MLNDLHIKNFRMLEDLHIAKLGRVNLIVGKNNCGKSTVLEALRLYASRAHPNVLQDILREHDEFPFQRRLDGEEEMLDWSGLKNLFPQRKFPLEPERPILVESNARVLLRLVHRQETDWSNFGIKGGVTRPYALVEVSFGENFPDVKESFSLDEVVPRQTFFRPYRNWLPALPVIFWSYVPTQLLHKAALAESWDAIALTPNEGFVLQALQIVEPAVQGLSFVSDPLTPSRRMAIVKLKDGTTPISLASMGDGMSRILQLMLAVFSARGGFLLIDEFENGLHFSVQEKVWRMIFKLANDLDIQVFATTHSWDCIESFTKVAVEDTDTEGVLLKLARSRLTGKVVARVYDEADLQTITASELEIR